MNNNFLNKKYKYIFIYLTKNLINNKKYIGWHSTNDLLDVNCYNF